MSWTKDQIVEETIQFLTNGITEGWKKPWASQMPTRFTGQEYTGRNILILMYFKRLYEHDSNVWITFNQAKKEDIIILDPKKSARIYFWAPITDPNTGEESMVHKTYKVFNLSNTKTHYTNNAIYLEEKPKMNIDIIEDLMLRVESDFNTNFKADRAAYSPATQLIMLPKREDFDSIEDFYHTFFHELGHAVGDKHKLRTELAKTSYAYEELVAEFTGSFLASKFNILSNTIQKGHNEYISHWVKHLKSGEFDILEVASEASKRVEFIMDNYYIPEEEEANVSCAA